MTEATSTEPTNQHPPPTVDDPRFGFAMATDAVRKLIESITADQYGLQTPCDDFLVKDLLDHLVMVMRRVAALGNGRHWSEVTEELATMDSGHAEAFAAAAHEVMEAWADPAKLEQLFEAPFGTFPGAPLILTYTAELAVHGWDLATALGAEFVIADEHLGGALVAAKMLPAEGRGQPDMPFDEVVDPGPDAPALLQMAGWMGRQV